MAKMSFGSVLNLIGKWDNAGHVEMTVNKTGFMILVESTDFLKSEKNFAGFEKSTILCWHLTSKNNFSTSCKAEKETILI